jgi:hypothetical protein
MATGSCRVCAAGQSALAQRRIASHLLSLKHTPNPPCCLPPQIALTPALVHPGAGTLSYLYPAIGGSSNTTPWGAAKVYPVTHWVVVDLATPRWAGARPRGGRGVRAVAAGGHAGVSVCAGSLALS